MAVICRLYYFHTTAINLVRQVTRSDTIGRGCRASSSAIVHMETLVERMCEHARSYGHMTALTTHTGFSVYLHIAENCHFAFLMPNTRYYLLYLLNLTINIHVPKYLRYVMIPYNLLGK